MGGHIFEIMTGAALAGILNRAVISWVRADPRTKKPNGIGSGGAEHGGWAAQAEYPAPKRLPPLLPTGIEGPQRSLPRLGVKPATD